MWMEILILLLLVFLVIIILLYRRVQSQNRLLVSRSQSLSTKYGKMTEQFMPFLKDYPYDEHNFRFIGSPVDGIQFEDDRLVVVEFKTGSSVLTTKQRKIRDLVKKGKVYFEEITIRE
jgi:predicted Holliday junction resolvase-like endonuclease